ncbi:MAG: LamG domain-containing protein, partial [Opitutales bacterium]
MNFTSNGYNRKVMAHAVSFQAAQSLSIATLLAMSLTCFAKQQPVGQWEFDGSRLRNKILLPAAGPWEGKVLGSAEVSREKPLALEAKKGFRGIVLHEDISKAGLPKEALSVTAWARVDKPIEWGGILGAIQDNGSFERGWLLGYGKDSFYFAVASEGNQRLTYLKSSAAYSPTFWYHLAGTYDGKMQRIYLDGKLSAESKAQKGPINYPPNGRFVIGAYLDQDEHFPMEGRIESIQLWDRALSAEEVTLLFKVRKERFPAIEPVAEASATEDWPTFLHDNERSGHGAASIKGKLSLRWTHRMRLPPQAAWPPPAKQDFWHKKYNLKPRVTYDRSEERR